MALRGGVAIVGLFLVYAAGNSVVSAGRAMPRHSPTNEAPRVLASTDVQLQGAATAPATLASAPAAPASLAPIAAGGGAEMESPLVLMVREGRSELPGDLIVERKGDSVVVDFDTQSGRTRRRDKFEQMVRTTLPLVYGPRAQSLLSTIPEGSLMGGGDLLTELPVRGLHFPMPEGWTLDLWPETRPGRDGPLVVSYRAKVRKN
jgi:hypothetical protein